MLTTKVAKSIYTVLTFMIHVSIDCSNAQESREKISKRIFSDYDWKLPPPTAKGKSTEVLVQIYIVSIDSIQELSMEYKMEIYLRQTWYDRRLVYNTTDDTPYIQFSFVNLTQIWQPDLSFTNAKQASFHNVVVPNRLLHIYPDGKVFSSIRLSLTLGCPMELQNFPFDEQLCPIYIESYSYTTEELLFKWQGDGVTIPDELSIPHFDWNGFTLEEKNITYTFGFWMNHIEQLWEFFSGGCAFTSVIESVMWLDSYCRWSDRDFGKQYTRITAMIRLSRHYGYYVTQIYMPCLLVVIMSWVSFWLEVDAIPARISLGLLTVLTMTTGTSSLSASLPRVSYVKAIDVWMAVCLFVVFASLLEFAFVNVVSRSNDARRIYMKDNVGQSTVQMKSQQLGVDSGTGSVKNSNSRQNAVMIDKVSRVLFPVLFGLFIIGYLIFVFCLTRV